MRKMLAQHLALLGFLILAVGNTAALALTWSTQQAQCRDVRNGRDVLRQVVIKSDRLLGTPGSAAFDYFREHPAALAAAHAENQRILREDLPPVTC